MFKKLIHLNEFTLTGFTKCERHITYITGHFLSYLKKVIDGFPWFYMWGSSRSSEKREILQADLVWALMQAEDIVLQKYVFFGVTFILHVFGLKMAKQAHTRFNFVAFIMPKNRPYTCANHWLVFSLLFSKRLTSGERRKSLQQQQWLQR